MRNFLKSLFGTGTAGELDLALVARIRDNLKREPSDQLRAMLEVSAAGNWSREALQAARLLLEERERRYASEPVYRTVPRTAREQAAREREAVAPGFDRQLLVLDVGSRVCCLWRKRDGTIIRWDDETDEFCVRFDNDETEWTDLRAFM